MIYVVHGSNVHERWLHLVAGYSPWWKSGSSFSRAVKAGFEGHCAVHSLEWTGKNTHAARLEAAHDLKNEIEKKGSGHRIHIVGHSHGGNVALLTASLLPPQTISTIVLLANPHVALLYRDETQCNRKLELKDCGGSRCHWMYWGKAAEWVERIWNLYSPQDKVQSVAARFLHGIPLIERQSPRPSIVVLRLYEGHFSDCVQNGRFLWRKEPGTFLDRPIRERGRNAHSAMHCMQMGTVTGRLMAGAEYLRTLADSGLKIDEPNEIRDVGV